MKVTRVVDTVIVEMDISLAEKLLTALSNVKDGTQHGYTDEHIANLCAGLVMHGEVRYPSPLYVAHDSITLDWKRG